MAGEMGADVVNSTVRTTETSLRMLLEILRFLRQGRQGRKNDLSKVQARKLKKEEKLNKMKGCVSVDKLNQRAIQNHDKIVPLGENMTLNQIEDLKKICSKEEICFSVIMDKSVMENITKLEESKEKIEIQAEPILKEIESLEQQKEKIWLNIETDNRTTTSAEEKKLKEIDTKIEEKKAQINKGDYLNENDRVIYSEIKRQLYGNKETGEKGLYDKQNEVSVMVCEKDTPRFLNVIKALNKKQMQKNIVEALYDYNQKEIDGTLSESDRELVEKLKKAHDDILHEQTEELNKKYDENVFESVCESKKSETLNFDEAVNHFVDRNIATNEPVYICDRCNPNSYIKINSEYNGERTIHTYNVFNDKEVKKAPNLLRSNGVFTDKDSKNADGTPKKIKYNGKSVAYWTALKKSMLEQSGINYKNVVVFSNNEEFKRYQEQYNTYIKNKEATKEKNNHFQQDYDFAEDYDTSSFRGVLKSDDLKMKFIDCDNMSRNCVEEIEKQGYKIKNYGEKSEKGKSIFTLADKSGKEYSEVELINQKINSKTISENERCKAAMTIINADKIKKLGELNNLQTELILKIDKLARCTDNIEAENLKSNIEVIITQKNTIQEKIEQLDQSLDNLNSINIKNQENAKDDFGKDNLESELETPHGEELDMRIIEENCATIESWKSEIENEKNQRGNDTSQNYQNMVHSNDTHDSQDIELE